MDYWWWFILGIGLLVMEIMVPGFIVLWFGIGAVLTGFFVWMIPELSVPLQLLTFGGASLVGLIGARRFLTNYVNNDTDQPGLNDWKTQMIGQVYVLINPIVDGTGTVKVGDSTWKVRGDDMVAGSKVKVTSIDGSILHVEAVSS